MTSLWTFAATVAGAGGFFQNVKAEQPTHAINRIDWLNAQATNGRRLLKATSFVLFISLIGINPASFTTRIDPEV